VSEGDHLEPNGVTFGADGGTLGHLGDPNGAQNDPDEHFGPQKCSSGSFCASFGSPRCPKVSPLAPK